MYLQLLKACETGNLEYIKAVFMTSSIDNYFILNDCLSTAIKSGKNFLIYIYILLFGLALFLYTFFLR